MPTTIEFWFDFSSPYAYFASLDIERRLTRFKKALLWRPYLLGVAYQTTGMRPLSLTPMRGDYARHDWQRIAESTGAPFTLCDDHPFPSQSLARAYYWLAERESDLAVAFAKAAFHHYFGEGRSLRSTEAVLALAERYTDNTYSLRCWLDTDEARQVLRERTAEALGKGVFGSPFFLVGREPFWGWDRLPMIENWLERRASTAAKPSMPGNV
jgi:2-hydroxychromene-2-carboxylate isomerase